MTVMQSPESSTALKLPKHHVQEELCTTRPPYRQGRKLTAVKAYTINNESQHLFVYGVPKIDLRKELKQLFINYGRVLKIHTVADHETELFTECFHLQFERIQSARIAKRLVDNKSFYGGILHVCYAPECESVEETRAKLQQRRKDVLSRLNGAIESKNLNVAFPAATRQNRKRKNPAIELSDERLDGLKDVWEGVPAELDPRLPQPKVFKPNEPRKHYLQPNSHESDNVYGPTQPEGDDAFSHGVSISPCRIDHQTLPKLIPTQVAIKSKNIVKRIVFRNGNKT